MPSIDNSSLDSAPNTTAATTATTTTGRGQNPKALFITGLSLDAEFIDLHKHFDRFGEIVLCRVLKDAKTGVSRGIGYVNYDSEAEAAAAQAATDGQPGPRDEPSISVKFAEADPTYRAVATTKVFVRYVPVDFTTAQVAEVFSKYGKVLDVVIDADRSRAVKKGPTPWNYAYVQYGTTAEANKAIAYGAREVQWSSRPITVKPAEGEETRQLRCGKTATTTTTTAAPQTTQPQQPAHPPTASTTRSNTPIKDANAKTSSAAASTAAASAPATPPASVSLVQPDIPTFAFPQSAAATTNTAATYTMALPQSADFFVQPDGVCAQQPTFVFAPAGAMAMAPQPTYFMAAPGGAPQFFAPQQPGAMQYVQFMPYHPTAPTMHCGVAPANAVSPQWLSMPTMTAAPAPSPYTSMASPWATEHTVHPFLATF